MACPGGRCALRCAGEQRNAQFGTGVRANTWLGAPWAQPP